MKLIKATLLFLLLITVGFNKISAQEDEYIVYDSASIFTQNFSTYKEAFNFYSKNLDNYDNLVLKRNGKVIDMEYGVVYFNNDDTIDYYSIQNNQNDILLGTYGADAAYLYTKNDNAYFMISGDKGYVKLDDITLIPYEELQVDLSKYQTKDNQLYHNIKTQLEFEHYTYSIALDNMPSFLTDNSDYYSYDVHYFYSNFYTMIDDYRNNSNLNAINDIPYYNYYQYLPSRSLTNYDYDQLEEYFYNTLGINGRLTEYNDLNGDAAAEQINKSQLYGEIDAFFNYQNLYGSNALMAISCAINESSYGRSIESYLNNNLFANTAYSSIVEKENGKYESIEKSIYAYDKYYISSMYSNNLRSDYSGTFFGNKSCGLNHNYSIDTYFGEKAAAIYYKIDKALGFKDYNSYAFGIINNKDIKLYSDADLTECVFSIDNINELSYIILDETEKSYKIQIDNSNNNEYFYDFTSSVVYINKEDINYVFNLDSIIEKEFNNITYDFDFGLFCDNSSLTVKIEKGKKALNFKPYKEGYEFIGYNNDLSNPSEDIVYKAIYEKIDSISIGYLLEKQNECYPYPDLNDAYINVKYEDGKNKIVSINTDMLSKYDPYDSDPQTITVTYNGINAEKTIQIDTSFYEINETVRKAIENKDYEYIKSNINNTDYILTMSQIREIDSVLKQKDNRNYVITNTPYREKIELSGLDLSLADKESFIYINDTYYVSCDPISNFDKNTIMNVAREYGFEEVDGINISFSFNYQDIELNGPTVIKLDVDNKQNDCIYSVYHLDSNGDVIKCKSVHSNNSVQFIIYESGSYLLLKMNGVNKYDIEDSFENLSYENMGIDNNRINLELLIIIALIIFSLAGITIYYIFNRKKENQWKDYKKSLH